MSLRPRELAQVVQELSSGLAGARVQKVWATSPQRLYLSLRQPGRTTLLLLCSTPQVSRLSVVAERSEETQTDAASLQRFFRQELEGATLTRIGQRSARTVELVLERADVACRVLADFGSGARLLLEKGIADPSSFTLEEASPSRLVPQAGTFPLAEAAERLFAHNEGAQTLQLLRRLARSPIEAQRKRLDRTIVKVTAEADREAQAERHRVLGELLRHHATQIPRGAKQAKLTEYTTEGPREVEVALDPALSPREQVERHFHQYRRLLRGSARAQERLTLLQAERGQLEAKLATLDALPLEALVALKNAAPERIGPPSLANAPGPRKPYREYRSEQGVPIFVGRGGTDNDALTFKVAKPEHWWFHARGVPGAHVVLPLGGNAELPNELMLDAAHLAHYHSDNKTEPQGEVSYTHAKFVRKVKKGAPGQVTYTREKTFWLRVDPARLGRLLGNG